MIPRFSSVMLAASLMVAAAPSQAVVNCTATNTACFNDNYETAIQLFFTTSTWKTSDWGSAGGIIELPPAITGYTETLKCPLMAYWILNEKIDTTYSWFTLTIDGGCFCGADGADGNPTRRVMEVKVNRLNGKVEAISAMTAHAWRCDGSMDVLYGEIGPYPSSAVPFPSTTPDWE